MTIVKELICCKITTGIFLSPVVHTDYEIKQKLKPVVKIKEACDFLIGIK